MAAVYHIDIQTGCVYVQTSPFRHATQRHEEELMLLYQGSLTKPAPGDIIKINLETGIIGYVRNTTSLHFAHMSKDGPVAADNGRILDALKGSRSTAYDMVLLLASTLGLGIKPPIEQLPHILLFELTDHTVVD